MVHSGPALPQSGLDWSPPTLAPFSAPLRSIRASISLSSMMISRYLRDSSRPCATMLLQSSCTMPCWPSDLNYSRDGLAQVKPYNDLVTHKSRSYTSPACLDTGRSRKSCIASLKMPVRCFRFQKSWWSRSLSVRGVCWRLSSMQSRNLLSTRTTCR